MYSFLIIAGLICILDITGFKCSEVAESILYSEDDTGGATCERADTKATGEKEDEAQPVTKAKATTAKSTKGKTKKPNKETSSKTAKEAEELIKDIYE